jgi:hypothetical protein
VLVRFDYGASFIINANHSVMWSAVELAGLIQFVAHRGDGKRFVVRADEKLTAFVELEAAIRDWSTW